MGKETPADSGNTPPEMQAIVLAGGKGERLRPFTVDRPKAMVEVHGVPLLAYQLRWLREQGVDQVVIACGYRHEALRDYFGDGASWDLGISYSIEEEPLGRGGALRRAFSALSPTIGVCVATNGDIVTDLPLAPVLDQHRQEGASATVVVTPFRSPYGIVDVDEANRVRGFREKPELPYWINAGIYLLSRSILPLLPERGDHEVTTFPRLAAEGRLAAYRSRAFWRGVDTVKDLEEVAAVLSPDAVAR
ncbi:MAG TPA: nucleotidyltransferase family protein [bacterium]|jgi:NDP-sugar pyrophosphorylase family protein|nr:nucleotidyltransferase family protein [bacterium]